MRDSLTLPLTVIYTHLYPSKIKIITQKTYLQINLAEWERSDRKGGLRIRVMN